MSQEEITIYLPNGDIQAIVYGDKSAPPMLAMHGWLDSAASFDYLAPLLPDFRIIAIDLPGHGLSSHRPKGAYFHIAEYIADAFMVADELGWDRFSILGHSLGAAIGCLMAGTMPERVIQLGLIDALGPYAVKRDELPHVIRKSILDYQRLPKKRVPHYHAPEEAMTARLRKTPMLERSVKALVDRNLKQTDSGYVWRNDPRLLLTPLLMLTEEDIETFLQSITCPTCLIRPDDGWPFSETLFNSRTQCVANLEVHRMPGQHHVHLDDPEGVRDILLPFFKENVVG